MGSQFIQQPDGKWAIWSSIVDDFTHLNCEPWELFAIMVEREMERQWTSHEREMQKLRDPDGHRRWTQMTWEEALEHRRVCHEYGPCEDEPGEMKGRKDFNPDPFADSKPAGPPKIENVEDFFRAKLMYLLEFYAWFKQQMQNKGTKDPPEWSGPMEGKQVFDQTDLDEPQRTELRQQHLWQHYEELLCYFSSGRLTSPLCPHCKEIVDEEGQACAKCKERL